MDKKLDIQTADGILHLERVNGEWTYMMDSWPIWDMIDVDSLRALLAVQYRMDEAQVASILSDAPAGQTESEMNLTKCETKPERDPYNNGVSSTVLKIYESGNYALLQEYNDNATPESEWNGRTLAETITNRPDEEAAKKYLVSAEAVALVARVHAGHTVDWNGSNMVGSLDEDGRAALDELVSDLENLPESDWVYWDVDDWFQEVSDGELGIRPGMTEAEIEALALKLEQDALTEHAIVDGIDQYVRSAVERMTEAEE